MRPLLIFALIILGGCAGQTSKGRCNPVNTRVAQSLKLSPALREIPPIAILLGVLN